MPKKEVDFSIEKSPQLSQLEDSTCSIKGFAINKNNEETRKSHSTEK